MGRKNVAANFFLMGENLINLRKTLNAPVGIMEYGIDILCFSDPTMYM